MNSIIQNQTIGEIVKSQRERLAISWEEAESELKIKPKFLKAIENNRFQIFPSHTQAKGFLKNYADFLGLNYEMLVAIYRRDIENINMKRKVKLIEEEPEVPESKTIEFLSSLKGKIQTLRITPGVLIGIFSMVVVIIFVSVIFSAVRRTFSKPDLEITSPVSLSAEYSGNLEFYENSVVIRGKTDKNTLVTINDKPVVTNSNNEFESDLIPVNSSTNKIIVLAENNFGAKSKIELNLVEPEVNIKSLKTTISVNSEAFIRVKVDSAIRLEQNVLPGESYNFEALENLEIETTNKDALEVKINEDSYVMESNKVLFTNLRKEIKQESI